VSNKRTPDPVPELTLSRDEFSQTLRDRSGHPEGVTKESLVNVADFYGNLTTWVVRTVRVEGQDTVFLQRNHAGGGDRFVLPPEVTAVLARHRDTAATVNRRRGARRSAANRKALGIAPAFLKKASEA
jgi:hypothetical protein